MQEPRSPHPSACSSLPRPLWLRGRTTRGWMPWCSAIINKECMTTRGTTDHVSKVENIVIPAEGRQIPVRVYRPGGDGPHPVLVFLHGGAMLAGNLETHDNACRYLCNRTPCTVASVRLPPCAGT